MKWLLKLPLDKLALVAALGGVIGLTTMYGFRNHFTQKISRQKYFVDAVKKLKEDEAAKFILGTPIITKESIRIFGNCFTNFWRLIQTSCESAATSNWLVRCMKK